MVRRRAGQVADSIERSGFGLRYQIIWAKSGFAISRGHYHWAHEPCWYAVRRGRSARWSGDRRQRTVWQISNVIAEAEGHTFHGAQKPVECMARPLRNDGTAGDAVYDPFLGSGTSVIAAQQTDRRCLGIELDPRYCDVVVERWENFTGGKARRTAA